MPTKIISSKVSNQLSEPHNLQFNTTNGTLTVKFGSTIIYQENNVSAAHAQEIIEMLEKIKHTVLANHGLFQAAPLASSPRKKVETKPKAPSKSCLKSSNSKISE